MIAETNAVGFGFDDADIHLTDRNRNTIEFRATLRLDGDHDPEKPFAGDLLTLEMHGTATREDGTWEITSYRIEDHNLNLG